MMKWYSVESTVAESVDVQMIWHGFSPPGERTDTDSIDNTNTDYYRGMGKVRGYCF